MMVQLDKDELLFDVMERVFSLCNEYKPFSEAKEEAQAYVDRIKAEDNPDWCDVDEMTGALASNASVAGFLAGWRAAQDPAVLIFHEVSDGEK